MLTVLTGFSQESRTADTCSSLPQTCVTVWAMLKTCLVTVTPPQTSRTWFTTSRTLMGKMHNKNLEFIFLNGDECSHSSRVKHNLGLRKFNWTSFSFFKDSSPLSNMILSSKLSAGNPRVYIHLI